MSTINPYKDLVAQKTLKAASRAEEHVVGEDGAYNPTSLGSWQSALRGVAAQPKDRLFSKEGELNAWNKEDALYQIAHLMQNVTKTAASKRIFGRGGAMDTEKRRIVAEALRDHEGPGFRVLGQELLLPIKDLIDYEGWARKIFRVRKLQQGEFFRIARDVRSVAWIIGQDGQSIESRVRGKYIQLEEFKITSYPTVDISDVYQVNYDILDRVQDTARQEIELKEDVRALALLDQAARSANAVTTFATLGVAAFEDVQYQVERHRKHVAKFLINRQELGDIKKTMSAQIDPVSERELLLAGYIGKIFNADVITAAGTGVEEVVPAGTFYACTDSDYLGEMGIRIELFSEPFNKFSHMQTVKGWAFVEELGFGIPSASSVAVGEK